MYFSFFAFCALGWCVVQAELDVLFEDAACIYVNKEYIKEDSCQFEVNDDSEYDTSLFTHLEVIKQLPRNIKAQGNVNGIEMGEYTNDIGLHVELEICNLASGPPNIATPMVKALNWSPENCPPKPGVYGNENFVIDSNDGLPPSFPIGKYMLNITLLSEEIVILNIQVYLTVV